MWTSRERAEIGRLKNAFGRDLYDLYWIEGVTDHGEPFFVALRIIDDSLVLHLARIDGLYIALDENLEKAVEGPNLVEFINACVEHVRSPREGPSAGVVPIYAYRNGIAVWATLLAEVLREELSRNDDGGASPSSAPKHNKSDRTGLEGETRRASGQSGDQVELLGADRSARFARPTPAPVTTELRSHSTDPLVSAALLRTAMAATVVELAAASVEAAEVEAIEDGTLRLADAKALFIHDAPPPDPSQSEDAQPARTTLSPGLQDWSRPSSDPFQGNQFGAFALADSIYSEAGRFAFRTGLAEAHSSDKKAASTLPLSAEDGVDRVPHADYATPCSLDGEVGASFNIGADASTGEEAHCAPSDEAQVAETAPEPLVSEPAQVPEVSPRTPSSLTAPNSGQSSLPTVDRVLLDVLEWQPEVPEAPQEQPAGSNDAPLPEIRDTPEEELEEPAPAGALTPPNTPDLQEAQEPGDMGAAPDVDQAPLEVALYLINPVTDERVAEITEGATLHTDLVPGGQYSIEAELLNAPDDVGSVSLSLNGALSRVENLAPYALFGDLEGDFGGSGITPGPKSLSVTVHPEAGGMGGGSEFEFSFRFVGPSLTQPAEAPAADEGPETVPSEDVQPQSAPTLPDTVTLYLIDVERDQRIVKISDGATLDFDLFETELFSIEAVFPGVSPDAIGSVSLSLDGGPARIENTAPYALFGDGDGDFYPGSEFTPGGKAMKVTVHAGADGTGDAREFEFAFSVEGTVDVTEAPDANGSDGADDVETDPEELPPQSPSAPEAYLIDVTTDQRVAEITEGAALDIGLVDDGRYSIEVVPPGGMAVDYVTLSLNGSPARVEKAAPYALFGDLEGDFGAGSELTAGPKTLEYEIFDTSGSSTTQQLTFDVVGAESEPEPVGRLELGTSRIAQADPDSWTRIDFDEAIPDAVVVMGPLSANGSSPTTVRVRNVDETGFEVQIDEWMYLDGAHSTETVSWMAATAGVHTLADGTTIAAGSVNAYNSVRKSVDFGTAFTEDPAFFAQVASANGSQAVTIRTEDVTEAGADVFLQEEEATNHPSHSTERVDWIAVAPGLSEAWEIGSLEVGDDPISFAYDQPEPVILAAMQTADGGDTATLRIEDHSANQTTIWVSEERSFDQETESALQDVKILVSGENAFDLY